MISSCAKKNETGYYSVETTVLGDNELGFYRNNMFLGTTETGGSVVAVTSDAKDQFISGYYSITIEEDGDYYLNDGDSLFSPDAVEYEINGDRFCEVSVVSDDLEHVVSAHYSVGKDDSVTEDDDITAGMTDIATTDVFQTSAGTCLVASDDVLSFREDSRQYLFYYSGDPHEPQVYDLSATLGGDFRVDAVFSDNGKDILVSGYDLYYVERVTYRIDPDTDECTDESAQWPSGNFGVYQGEDLYFYDNSGIYLYNDGSFEQKVDYSKCDFNIVKLSDMELTGCEDGGYQLTYVDYSAYDYIGKLYKAELKPCEDPTEGKTVVEVGIAGYVGDTVGDLLYSYNHENSSVYLAPVIIDPWSLDPRCAIDAEIPEDLDDYGKTLYMAKLESDAIADYISGPDAPDILISDGTRINLQREGLLDDLGSFVTTLDTALVPGVIEASYVGDSIYQIPLYYYIVGIAEFSGGNDPSVYRGIGYYDYSYKVNGDWEETDPITLSLSKTDYAEELISCQYDLFWDGDLGSPDFHNAAFYALLEYMNTVNADEYDYSQTYIYYYDDSDRPPEYTVIYSIQDYDYFNGYAHVSTWYSLPSYDERGLSATALSSAAIVSSSDKKEEGKAFIAYLLSMQTDMDPYDTYGLPVNLEALEMISEEQEGAFEFFTQATENVDSVFVVDADLRYVCRDALDLYFQGAITADETADMVEQGIENIIGGE